MASEKIPTKDGEQYLRSEFWHERSCVSLPAILPRLRSPAMHCAGTPHGALQVEPRSLQGLAPQPPLYPSARVRGSKH